MLANGKETKAFVHADILKGLSSYSLPQGKAKQNYQSKVDYRKIVTKSTPSEDLKKVTVRVWKSALCGHASVETNKYYVSFWPKSNVLTKGHCSENGCRGSDNDHFHSLEDDRAVEGHAEHREKEFYNLDYEKINKAVDKLLEHEINWTLWISFLERNPYDWNCCALTLFLLEEGGLELDSWFKKIASYRLYIYVGLAVIGHLPSEWFLNKILHFLKQKSLDDKYNIIVSDDPYEEVVSRAKSQNFWYVMDLKILLFFCIGDGCAYLYFYCWKMLRTACFNPASPTDIDRLLDMVGSVVEESTPQSMLTNN